MRRIKAFLGNLAKLLAKEPMGFSFPGMKSFVLGLLVMALSIAANAEDAATTNAPPKIPAEKAKDHIGDNAIVTGKVAEVSKAEKLVRLNLGKGYPNQTFTVVVFATKTNLFGDFDNLKGKDIEATGKIADYHGRPQMVLTASNQLSVVERPKSPTGIRILPESN